MILCKTRVYDPLNPFTSVRSTFLYLCRLQHRSVESESIVSIATTPTRDPTECPGFV
jgi:hypothetical protein